MREEVAILNGGLINHGYLISVENPTVSEDKRWRRGRWRREIVMRQWQRGKAAVTVQKQKINK